MSGIEVAGLLLGAFPILISGLDSTRKGYQGIESWWKIRAKYNKCLNAVKAEHVIFKMNLIEVLRTISYDEDELNRLLAHPGGAEWSSDDLERRLKDRLPMSHQAYIDTMEAMNVAIVALGEELGVGKIGFQQRVAAGKVEHQQKPPTKQTMAYLMEKLQYETHRIRFTANADVRHELLEELRQGNGILKRYSEERPAQSRPLQRRSGRKRAMSPSLYGYWQHAKDLYRLIQEASSCSCRASHRAHITLRPHPNNREIEFRVLFTYAESITCQDPNGWDWKETRIILEPPSQPAVPTEPNPPVDVTLTTMDSTAIRVSWAASTLGTALLPMRPASTTPRITDLCATIATPPPDCSCLGVLGDSQNRYSIQLPNQQLLPKTTLEHVTLQDILASRSRIRLNRRQRYRIALAVASAYLQLHASPWLGPNCDKRDINFLFDPAKSTLYDEPRITRDFVTDHPQGSADHSIGALGITLLELVFDSVLEEYPLYSKNIPSDGRPTEWSDTMTAKQWCHGHAFDEEEDFANAILWCLKNSPTRGPIENDKDSAWRQELFDNVVEPLAVCCKRTFG